jgi:hypothetical protein
MAWNVRAEPGMESQVRGPHKEAGAVHGTSLEWGSWAQDQNPCMSVYILPAQHEVCVNSNILP